MRNFLSLILFTLIISACGFRSFEETQISESISISSDGINAAGSEIPAKLTSTEIPAASILIEEEPIQTSIPTRTPTQTPAPTNTPTPTPAHPLMIEVMRTQEYPGSEIVFEETLEDGANYDRYIISYQSEGNKIYALFTVPYGEPPDSGWPVIIFNHGYIPPEVYRTTERYVNYVDVLARNGYIVFRSDYRGHGNSEGEPKSSYQSPGIPWTSSMQLQR